MALVQHKCETGAAELSIVWLWWHRCKKFRTSARHEPDATEVLYKWLKGVAFKFYTIGRFETGCVFLTVIWPTRLWIPNNFCIRENNLVKRFEKIEKMMRLSSLLLTFRIIAYLNWFSLKIAVMFSSFFILFTAIFFSV